MSIGVSILILFIVVPFALGVYLLVTSRGRESSGSPRCGYCQYDLTGSTANRCPECGKLFIEAGVVTQRRTASRPRFWVGVAVLCMACVFAVGGLLSSLMYARANAARAQAMAARSQALARQAAATRNAALVQQTLAKSLNTGSKTPQSDANKATSREAPDDSIESD